MTIKLDRELVDLLRPYSEAIILLQENGLDGPAHFVDQVFERAITGFLPEVFESGRKKYTYTVDTGILEIRGEL